MRESEIADPAPAAMSAPAAFVPVRLADLGDRTLVAPELSAATPPPERVTLEIRRGITSVSASLPMDARSAAWLREVLA